MSKATDSAADEPEATAAAASSSSEPIEHCFLDGASSSATSLSLSSIRYNQHTFEGFNTAPKIEESDEDDEDMFTVPDVGDEDDDEENDSPKNSDLQLPSAKRRRGRNPVDRECRRLKRLLRNRVSAQQARERKKVYVHDMEAKAQYLVEANSGLEEKINTLTNENAMLRKILMNTRPQTKNKEDESDEEPTKELLR